MVFFCELCNIEKKRDEETYLGSKVVGVFVNRKKNIPQ